MDVVVVRCSHAAMYDQYGGQHSTRAVQSARTTSARSGVRTGSGSRRNIAALCVCMSYVVRGLSPGLHSGHSAILSLLESLFSLQPVHLIIAALSSHLSSVPVASLALCESTL